MKKIKLMAILLGVSIFMVGCQNGNQGKQETKKETKVESTKETKNETKKEKEVKIENLRTKDSKFLVIDGKEIKYKDFYKFYDLYAGVLSMRENLNATVTRLFIRDAIVNKDLEAKGIKVTEDEVKSEMDTYIKNVGGENEFNRYLNTLGVTKELFKENILNSIKNVKHKEAYVKSLKISNEEIDAFYLQNRDSLDYVEARHILVKDEKLAKEIYEKLKSGEDFKKLSDKYSIDNAAKANEGKLGKVYKNGKMDPKFAEAALKVKKGQYSEPVKTQFGYHIIAVDDAKVGKEFHVEEIKNQIADQKYSKDMQEKVSKLEVKFYDYDGTEIKK